MGLEYERISYGQRIYIMGQFESRIRLLGLALIIIGCAHAHLSPTGTRILYDLGGPSIINGPWANPTRYIIVSFQSILSY